MADSLASTSKATSISGKRPPTLDDIASRLKLDTTSSTSRTFTADKENIPGHHEPLQLPKGRLGLPGRLKSYQSDSSDQPESSASKHLTQNTEAAILSPPSRGSSAPSSSVSLHPDSAVAAVALPLQQITPGGSKTSALKSTHLPTLEDIRERILGDRRVLDRTAAHKTTSPGKSPHSPTMPVPVASGREVSPSGPTKIASTSKSSHPDVCSEPKKTSSDAGTTAKAEGSPGAPELHPLQHKWTLFFDCKTFDPATAAQIGGTADVSSRMDPSAPWLAKSSSPVISAPVASPTPQTAIRGGASSESWEAALKQVGQYETVESFLQVFAKIRRPSSLEKQSSYHLFKDGIKPMWEDPANAKGGKWIISFQRGGVNPALLDRSWMWLVLALIGEELDGDDDVTGAVVSLRPKADRIALWLRGKDDVTKINAIGRRLVDLLEIGDKPGISLEFNTHEGGGRRARGTPASPTGTWESFWSYDNFVTSQQLNAPTAVTTAGVGSQSRGGLVGQQGPSRTAAPPRQSASGGPFGRAADGGSGGTTSSNLLGRVV